jgi:hypothetical protein
VAHQNSTPAHCCYDRANHRWIDLQANNLGRMGTGQGLCVYDPEHNVILELHGGAHRYRNVPVGTRAYYGGGIGNRE